MQCRVACCSIASMAMSRAYDDPQLHSGGNYEGPIQYQQGHSLKSPYAGAQLVLGSAGLRFGPTLKPSQVAGSRVALSGTKDRYAIVNRLVAHSPFCRSLRVFIRDKKIGERLQSCLSNETGTRCSSSPVSRTMYGLHQPGSLLV